MNPKFSEEFPFPCEGFPFPCEGFPFPCEGFPFPCEGFLFPCEGFPFPCEGFRNFNRLRSYLMLGIQLAVLEAEAEVNRHPND